MVIDSCHTKEKPEVIDKGIIALSYLDDYFHQNKASHLLQFMINTSWM